MPASPLRMKTGAWVVSQTVSWLARASHCATTPRVSIGERHAVVVAEAALDDAVGLGAPPRHSRPCVCRTCAATLAPRSSWTSADAGAQRLFQIDHRRQRLELDHDVVERVLGDVAAFGDHDRQRLADVADLVLGERHLRALVEDDARDRRRRHQQRPGLPVVAEVVGGIDGDDAVPRRAPRDTSILRMRACATWLRRNAACSMPGSSTSSMNSAWPVRSRGPRCA